MILAAIAFVLLLMTVARLIDAHQVRVRMDYISRRIDLVHERIDLHYAEHEHLRCTDPHWQTTRRQFAESATAIGTRKDLAAAVAEAAAKENIQ